MGITKVELLLLTIVTSVVGVGVAAQPIPIWPSKPTQSFKPVQPAAPQITSTPFHGTCANYNAQLSQHGAPLNGDHPGFCGFSSARVTLNGKPFDQFWQGVANGTVPPPYQVSYSSGPNGECATAQNLDIKVSMETQTSRLNWADAASVGQACVNEWNRHDPALVSTATSAAASSALQRVTGYLNGSLPKTIQACVPGRPATRAQAFAKLANSIKDFMLPTVTWAQHSVSAEASTDGDCMLRCNQCSSGWAGIITLKKVFTKGGPPYFTATETLLVGGTSADPTKFLARWSAVGGGTYRDQNGSLTWSLNADVPGQCDPLTNAVCIQAINQPGGSILFEEVNAQVVVQPPAVIPCPASSQGYQYTQTLNGYPPDPVQCGAAAETGINGENISTMSPTSAMGMKTEPSCGQRPPLNPGGYSCTQTWIWELYKQN